MSQFMVLTFVNGQEENVNGLNPKTTIVEIIVLSLLSPSTWPLFVHNVVDQRHASVIGSNLLDYIVPAQMAELSEA